MIDCSPATTGPAQETTTLTYNTVGELLTVDATAPADDVTYTWNAAGQMVGVQKGTQNITYQYNGFGQRVAETINGVLTRQWLWCGGSATPCEERDAQGYLLARYFPQGEQRITGVATPVVENLHYLRDRLGSVIGLTDATGTLISRLSYDLWGRTKLEFGTVTPAFGFAGMLRDPSTGLYQTWRRPYDPNLGRWPSRDPLGNPSLQMMADMPGLNLDRKSAELISSTRPVEMLQGPNLYSYVGNNSVNLTDPLGLWYIDINISGGFWGGVTGGVFIGPNGVHPYLGGGFVTPGVSGSVSWSPQDSSPGCWSVQGGVEVGPVFGAGGYGGGSGFWEVGGGWGWPAPLGANVVGYYTW